MAINRNDELETLEDMVDRCGSMYLVLDMLHEVCCLKSEHYSTNWMDSVSAKAWDKAARIIDKARAQVESIIS